MTYAKLTITSLSIAVTIFFTACGGGGPAPQGGDFVYRGHDFGPDRNSVYRQGVTDGCKTVDGDYTKNHTLFNTSEDYHDGWEHGRLHCKGKQ